MSRAACNRHGPVAVQAGIRVGGIMHTVTAARPLARTAAALACIWVFVLGLAAVGSAGSPSAAGSPVPAPAISRLAAIASRAARANGDSAPSLGNSGTDHTREGAHLGNAR